MKNFFIAIMSIILISSASAENLCTLTSEEDQEVTITIDNPGSGYGFGTLNYKKVPSFLFEVGISNGYGTQYYVLRTFSPDALNMDSKKTHSERFKNTKVLSSGRFVNFVGSQLARVTSKKERKSGKLKALMPTLPEDYYYYLPNNVNKGEHGRFNLSTKMKAILNASEGFFIDSGGCDNFFAYGWQ